VIFVPFICKKAFGNVSESGVHSYALVNELHLALAADGYDGLYFEHTADGCHRLVDSAAALQIFEGIERREQFYARAEFVERRNHLFDGALFKAHGLAHKNFENKGRAFAVVNLYFIVTALRRGTLCPLE